jgi:predicted nucleic acid-binding protein
MISESLDIIRQFASSLRTMTLSVHTLGVEISQRHSLSFYDSLMLAAALLDGCETFYREDMQNGLVIDGRLTITNPFLAQPEP